MKNLITQEKHYVTLNNYLRDRFGEKVFRVSLNAGFTCPNRDGTIGIGGCYYCSAKLSGDFAGNVNDSLKTQFEKGVELESKKWDSSTYIAYLQAGTNTYAPVDKLRAIYNEIINISDQIKVLSIATRPDCINKDVIEVLKEVSKKCEVWVELGLQSINNTTAILINRGYKLPVFEEAVKLLNEANIKVIVHIINGLPFDSRQDMINAAKYLNKFDIFGIKIHMLHVMKGTPMAIKYSRSPFKLLSLQDFVEITVEQLRHLNTNIVIHRLTGDSPKELLVAPKWTLKKFVVLNEIDKYMRMHNYYQGDLC